MTAFFSGCYFSHGRGNCIFYWCGRGRLSIFSLMFLQHSITKYKITLDIYVETYVDFWNVRWNVIRLYGHAWYSKMPLLTFLLFEH